jgi:hypothetical protein
MAAMVWWHWLFATDGGLAARLAAGVTVLLALAVADLVRRGRKATRWKEYLFLLACVAGAVGYALVNDMVTVTISPEYFIVHAQLSPGTPNVRAVAATLAVKGAWWVGAILGVAMLLANNPLKRWPRLGYWRMYPKLAYPLTVALCGSLLLAAAGYSGWFDGVLRIEDRLRGFCVVYWIHTAAYYGGALGGVAAVAAILAQRRRAGRRAAASGSST